MFSWHWASRSWLCLHLGNAFSSQVLYTNMGIRIQALTGMVNYIALFYAMQLLIHVLISILVSPITCSNMGPGTRREVYLRGTNYALSTSLFRWYRIGIWWTFLTVKYSIHLLACLLMAWITNHRTLFYAIWLLIYVLISVMDGTLFYAIWLLIHVLISIIDRGPGQIWQFILGCPNFKRFVEIWLNDWVPGDQYKDVVLPV